MFQKEVQKIIKDISLRKGIPYEVAEDIIRSEFDCIRESLKEGEYDDPNTFRTVHLKYLGKFVAPEAKINKIKKAKEKSNDSSSS